MSLHLGSLESWEITLYQFDPYDVCFFLFLFVLLAFLINSSPQMYIAIITLSYCILLLAFSISRLHKY